MTTTEFSAPPSLTEWRQRAVHTITLPTGMVVKARIPNLATLIEHDALPEAVRAVAMLEFLSPEGAGQTLSDRVVQAQIDGDTKTLDELRPLIRELGGLQAELIVAGVVEPQLTREDVAGLPEEDMAMLADIFQRTRVFDARGVRIGVAPIEWAARFREEHGCDEGCDACQKVLDAASSVQLGSV